MLTPRKEVVEGLFWKGTEAAHNYFNAHNKLFYIEPAKSAFAKAFNREMDYIDDQRHRLYPPLFPYDD